MMQTLIVGAGPIGLELAAALKVLGHDYVHIEAGQVAQTITWYPRQVRFFSSPDRIAVAGLPLVTADQSKASREEYLAYLRSVVQHYQLEVRTYERVVGIERQSDCFVIRTTRGEVQQQYAARRVVLAIGDMHHPRMLHIPGEDLGHVSHYFEEPHAYFGRKLLIVGGRNSAVEAAIRCQRAGAQVAISYRRGAFDSQSVKYWLLPEIDMLIKTGKVGFYPNTKLAHISRTFVTLDDGQKVEADFVLLLTGYAMDTTLLTMAGVELVGDNCGPRLDAATMQSNVPGLYVVGTAAGGTQHRFRLFIENCHAHVAAVVRELTGQAPPFALDDRTTSGRYGLPES